jgi:hypothetical protein
MNSYKPYTISIDKDGLWYYNGRQIIHPTVLRLFNDGLSLVDDGTYILEVEGDRAAVEVEDAPIVVRGVMPVTDEDDGLVGFILSLSDDTKEALDPETLSINEKNIPYCMVKREGLNAPLGLPARFASKAYYSLAEYIRHDEDEDTYFIETVRKRFTIPYQGADT